LLKRLFDLSIAIILLVVLSPLFFVIGLLIYIKMGSPILFRQVRPGLKGRPFTIYKFRTMIEEKGKDGRRLSDSERLTPLGRWLRKTSIDELPQLLNVVKGDLSFVGPRPLLMEYLSRYTPEQARRHEVKPGITGWAQINGRNAIDWEERFKLDVWYVDNHSLWLDMKILLRTFIEVWKGRGVSSQGMDTMPKFMGSGVIGGVDEG
jgi:lipopolysaccharide/colanic/teichoic acid biosynthesis glycosyltransferase